MPGVKERGQPGPPRHSLSLMNGIGHLPSVENLQCFVAASDHLNFRRAAAEMALTPTAFGQRIKQLEEQLGLELFARTTRHVALTPAGHRLLPAARDAIAAARRCTELVHHGESISARFTLGTRFELGMSWIVPALLELKRVRPNWHIDLYVGSGADIVDRLRARTLDTIVTSAPIARADWSAERGRVVLLGSLAAPAAGDASEACVSSEGVTSITTAMVLGMTAGAFAEEACRRFLPGCRAVAKASFAEVARAVVEGAEALRSMEAQILDEQQLPLSQVLDLKVGDTLMLNATPDSEISTSRRG